MLEGRCKGSGWQIQVQTAWGPEAWLRWQSSKEGRGELCLPLPLPSWALLTGALHQAKEVTFGAGQPGRGRTVLTRWLCNTAVPLLRPAHSLPTPRKVNNHNNKIIIRRCKRMDYNAVFVTLSWRGSKGSLFPSSAMYLIIASLKKKKKSNTFQNTHTYKYRTRTY